MDSEDLLRAGDNEPQAGADELRAIVARAQRRRWRVGAGGLAAALLIGGGAGYALSNHHSSGQSVATSGASGSRASSNAPSGRSAGPAAASSQSGSSSSSGAASAIPLLPQRLQPLFTRMAGTVDVRGFLVTSTIELPQGYAMPSCVVTGPRFQAEVSTAKMVGTAVSGYVAPDSTTALSDVSGTVIGEAEGDPTLVVIAAAGKGVAQVQVTGFAGGATDIMAPVDGWVALAGPTTSPSSPATPVKAGTITALSASGQVLASESVTAPTLFSGPLPLSSAAGAQAVNGASVVCEGGSSGSGTVAPGRSTGTLHVTCPPPTVPPAAVPGGSTGSTGGAPSNVGSNASSATCAVHVEPAVTSPATRAAG